MKINFNSPNNTTMGGNRKWNICVYRSFLILALSAQALLGQAVDFEYDTNGNQLSQQTSVAAAPTIITGPSDVLLQPGGVVRFSAVASGPGTLSYQWQHNNIPILGETGDTLVVTGLAIDLPDYGEYSVIVSNANGNTTSNSATVLPDSNSNDLPDAWELLHFGDLNQLGYGDYDGDQISNLDEYHLSLNPTSPTYLLRSNASWFFNDLNPTGTWTASGLIGEPFQFQLEAVGSPSSYTAAGLPPGLSIDPESGLISGVFGQAGVFTVHLEAQTSHGPATGTLILTVQTEIFGNVTDEQTGLPLEDIQVTAYQYYEDPYFGSYWDSVSSASTDVNGNYSIRVLDAGAYRIGFHDNSGGYITEYYDNAADLDSADDITIVGTSQTVNASLATASRIEGTVTAAQGGLPLEYIDVEVYQWDPVGEDWSYVSYGYTDENGNYRAGWLSAGTYRIGFFDYSYGLYETEYYDNSPDLSSATDITITTGQTVTGVDAALETPVAAGYVGWAAFYGLEGEFLSPGATPMNDEISNLLKYAFRLHPGEVATGTDRYLVPGSGISGLPHVSMEGGFLKVEYIRRKNSPDLIYQVEFCTSLAEGGPQGWQPVGETTPPDEIDSEWERVIVYDDVPASGGGARFGRVKAEIKGEN